MRFAAAGAKLQFTPTQFSGSGGAGIGAAGAMSTLGKTFRTMRDRAPKYARIGQAGIAAQNQKWRAANAAKTSILGTGMKVGGQIEASKIQANAATRAAATRAQGAMKGAVIGAIGSVGAALLSDETTKNTIADIGDALTTVKLLEPVSFHYNEEYTCSPERMHFGFVAQEYEKVMPDQTYYDPSINKMCIDTNELIALLVRSVQQLSSKVNELERR